MISRKSPKNHSVKFKYIVTDSIELTYYHTPDDLRNFLDNITATTDSELNSVHNHIILKTGNWQETPMHRHSNILSWTLSPSYLLDITRSNANIMNTAEIDAKVTVFIKEIKTAI